MRRFFAEKVEDHLAYITGEEARHAASVIRLCAGDRLIAIHGGMEYTCVVQDCGGGVVTARVEEASACKGDPKKTVTLYVSYLKSDKMELVAQKATELGASAICPFISQNSVKRPKDAKKARDRLAKICEGAVKQCGRSSAPEVWEPLTFQEMLEGLQKHGKAVFAYENADGDLKSALSGPAENIALIVGCEGGFTADEAKRIVEAGAVPVSLGARILRGETAAIALLAVTAYETGC